MMNAIEAIETLEYLLGRMVVRQDWVLYVSKTWAIRSELITKEDWNAIERFGQKKDGVTVWIEAGAAGDVLTRFALNVKFCWDCALDGEQHLMVFIDWFKRFDALMKTIKGEVES